MHWTTQRSFKELFIFPRPSGGINKPSRADWPPVEEASLGWKVSVGHSTQREGMTQGNGRGHCWFPDRHGNGSEEYLRRPETLRWLVSTHPQDNALPPICGKRGAKTKFSHTSKRWIFDYSKTTLDWSFDYWTWEGPDLPPIIEIIKFNPWNSEKYLEMFLKMFYR